MSGLRRTSMMLSSSGSLSSGPIATVYARLYEEAEAADAPLMQASRQWYRKRRSFPFTLSNRTLGFALLERS